MTQNEIDRTTICEKCNDEFKPYTKLLQSLFGDIGVDEDEMERFCRRCRFEMIGEPTEDTEQLVPCPRCSRQVAKNAMEPVKSPDKTLFLCGECADDEGSQQTPERDQ